MRIRKVDDNQKELVKLIRMIPGVTVKHTHMVSNGFVDIVVGHRKRNYLFEIKDYKKSANRKKLSPDEEKFHKEWTGQIDTIETIDDVIKILGI